MQHSGIGGFGKWDGVLILYHGLITKTVYGAALLTHILHYTTLYTRYTHIPPTYTHTHNTHTQQTHTHTYTHTHTTHACTYACIHIRTNAWMHAHLDLLDECLY